MTETALVKPEKFEDVVRDKVRKVLFDDLPDEQVDGFIKVEFDRFFKPVTNPYNNTEQPSPFSTMVRDELTKFFDAKIKEYVQRECAVEWDAEAQGYVIMESLVKKLAPAVLEGISGRICANIAQNIQNGNF